MSTTEPIEPVGPPAPAAPAGIASAVPLTRRSVTLPVLPLAIVGAVIVALIFFGGGIAIGLVVGTHDGRSNVQQYGGFGDRNGTQGGSGNGFGGTPGQRPTGAPQNG